MAVAAVIPAVIAVVVGWAWVRSARRDSRVMVTRSRAGAPWESGTISLFRACWKTVVAASQARAPWSRGS